MKKLLLLLTFLVGVTALFAQNDHSRYMELRIDRQSGWGFRLAPDLPFQKMGMTGRHIKPYLKDSEIAMKHFRYYRWNMVGSFASAYVGGMAIGYAMFSYFLEDIPGVIGGSAVALLGMGVAGWFGNKYVLQLQKAADAYNRHHNPSLSHIKPFLPTLQLSKHQIGVALAWDIH